MQHPHFETPEDYDFVLTVPPRPEGMLPSQWDPQWARFLLTYKDKELLRGTVSIHQLGQMQEELNRTISSHQNELRYNRSFAGVWNSYPVAWMWQLIQKVGFRYYAGGRSDTHLTHYFVRNLYNRGVLIRFKGKLQGASWPSVYFTSNWPDLFNRIEGGRYE